MRSTSVLFAFVCTVGIFSRVQAGVVYTRLTAATVNDQSRSFTIKSERLKDEQKGECLRFTVTVKAKSGKEPLSPTLLADLEVFDGDAVISSSGLRPTARGGEFSYSFLVAAKYAGKSKFSFEEILHAPNGEPLPAANCYWFYLKDFTAGDDDASKKELAALQGRWECYGVTSFGPDSRETDSLLYGGRKIERGVGLTVMALEVRGDTFTFAGTPAGKTTARLDPTMAPKGIDLTDAQGRTWVGAYEITDDTLTINLSMEKKRPTKVTDVGVFGQANAVSKRARK